MTTQSNIINDMSTFTRVPIKVLNELVSKAELCIGSAVHDALLLGESATVLNIGIGTLSIDLVSMQCKFMPSKELKNVIKKSITQKADPIEYELEQALIEKLLSICKDAED